MNDQGGKAEEKKVPGRMGELTDPPSRYRAAAWSDSGESTGRPASMRWQDASYAGEG